MYVEHVGKSIVTNHTTGHVGVIDYLHEGWYGLNKHKIQGDIFVSEEDRKKGISVGKISGTWSKSIYMIKNGVNSEVWVSSLP